MPVIEIATDVGTTKYIAPRPKVYLADALVEDQFIEEEFLYVDRLRVTVAPDVDTCQMRYDYGLMARPGIIAKTHFEPLEIVGRFVKVVIEPTVDNDEEIVWYGVVKGDQKQVYGSDGINPQGRQTITAFGVLALADYVVVNKSFIDDGASGAIEIETALPFNFDCGGQFPASGNRAANDVDDAPVFSKQQRSANFWSAADIVRYLLKRFAPKNNLDLDANEWKIDPDTDVTDMLTWNEHSLNAEFRTLKGLLDAVMDRKRGVGYWAKCVPQADTTQPNQILIHPFSFAAADVTLPSGATLKANRNLRSLDFEQALDVSAQVSDVMTDFYHDVKVVGEFMTSTLTHHLGTSGSTMFLPDWNQTEEDAYLAGASEDPEYVDWDDDQKMRMNAIARTNDILRNVFTRFKIDPLWDQLTKMWHDDDTVEYLAFPLIGEEDAVVDPVYVVPDNDTGETVWLEGLRILRHLVLRDRYNYTEDHIEAANFDSGHTETEIPEYLPPLVYICTSGTATDPVRDSGGVQIADCPRFEQVEKLNLTSFDTESGRQFACHVNLASTQPAVEIKAHPPQMLARPEWAGGGPAITEDSHDPTIVNGLDWRNAFITLTLEIPKRVQATKDIRPRGINEPLSTMVITVPGARCDHVAPFTTVAIQYGVPIVTQSGGFVKDDRMRVADIARAAAEWYGDDRKTLQLQYTQVRPLFVLGWLITDIGPNYQSGPASIKTPITAIDMVFPEGQNAPITTVETSFAALDFGEGRVSGEKRQRGRRR